MTYDGNGFWLIRKDGTKPPIYNYIKSLISNNPSLADKIGSTHVAGCYNFTSDCFLKEGADKIKELGLHVIKLWLTNQSWSSAKSKYPFNCNWDSLPYDVSTTADMLKHQNYQLVLNSSNFKTIILEAENNDVVWYNNTTTNFTNVKNAMYDATKYLLQTYKNTGKTFIFQNWEGDWQYIPPNSTLTSQPQSVKDSMISWFNARQDGVTQARNEVGENGVRVMCAAEVNAVSGLPNREHIIDKVIPYTHMDLYSYSNYEALTTSRLTDDLNYIANKSPNDNIYGFGNKNVYLGEFGCAENVFGIQDCYTKMKTIIDTGISWGVQYLLYWQLYDNECTCPPLICSLRID